MGDTLRLLQHDFLSSIPTIIFVIILLAILERLLFRPLAKVMKEREEASVGAQERAREEAERAKAKAREYEAALQAARLEVYDFRQSERNKAVAEHEGALKAARARAEERIKNGRAALADEVSAAKQQLTASSQSLAGEIAERILAGDALPRGNQNG
ncbi:MAG: ATP synthase F0 subunit B [Terriglobia bacterium]